MALRASLEAGDNRPGRAKRISVADRGSRNKIIQVVPGGDWFDPALVVRVRIATTYDGNLTKKPGIHIKFKDGEWTIACETRDEAMAYRDRIATLRNESP